jgi:hypothetical protein
VKLLKSEVQNSQRNVQILNDCQQALTNQCPGAKMDTSLHSFDSYIAQIGFEFIENSETRHFFQNIGTNFSLPGKTVDELKGIGCKILEKDRQFKKFITAYGKEPLQCGS